jgi:hypothetical protein
MNDDEISQFITAFEDFMKHSKVEELYHEGRECAKQYTQIFYEKNANKLGVSVEYYIQEFT